MIGHAHSLEKAHLGYVRSNRKVDSVIDRTASGRLISDAKRFQMVTRTTRRWLLRAVEYLAAQEDVGQFVDLGSGYPCAPHVHEVPRAPPRRAHALPRP